MGLWSDPGWPLLFWIQREPTELILSHLKLALIDTFSSCPHFAATQTHESFCQVVFSDYLQFIGLSARKNRGGWKRKDATKLVALQEEWDLDSASLTWKVSACNFHVPRAHNYWKGQPIPLHPAETGSLCSKAGKIHGPRRNKPLSRPGEMSLPVSVILPHQL